MKFFSFDDLCYKVWKKIQKLAFNPRKIIFVLLTKIIFRITLKAINSENKK